MINRHKDNTSHLDFFETFKTEDVGIERPKIIYSSRTHSQLAQVIDELKSTPYNPRTAVARRVYPPYQVRGVYKPEKID